MKYTIAICLLVLSFSSVSSALSVPKDFADAFVQIQELGPTGQYGDFVAIGQGFIIELDDCNSHEYYLFASPEVFWERDSIFVSILYIEVTFEASDVPVRLVKEGKRLWTDFSDSLLNIAIIPIPELLGMSICSIDTTYLSSLNHYWVGEDIVYFEFADIKPLQLGRNFPIARKGITAFMPRYYWSPDTSEQNITNVYSVFYIDANINQGSIGSPVFYAPRDSVYYPRLIGFLQGPYKDHGQKINLGVVASRDIMVKLIDIYHGCDK